MLSEVEQVCDQVVILSQGLVARTASPADFTRGTGECLVRVAQLNDVVRAAAAAVVGPAEWQGTTLRFTPRDIAQLNTLIDRLRGASAEIEAVEPVRLSLEQLFFQVVDGGGS
jgi:ABC-2 type transport system ATP-binding protein